MMNGAAALVDMTVSMMTDPGNILLTIASVMTPVSACKAAAVVAEMT